MSIAAIIALGTVVAVLAVMAGEAVLSAHNAAMLRARGALEPAGDPYQLMQVAYPLSFIVMGVEGAVTGPAPEPLLAAGLLIFGGAKALKAWAISSLGSRWSFRVLVPPGEPPVMRGPYVFMRHPNYLAVCGEILGVALIVGAPVSGVAAFLGFGWLMLRRIAVEDRALGRR
ncbi:MAG TPA: isoprenylcysteine carboxylmethyltransferase family protein [Vicinamibacterales bacterium]|nr:isoprenylcysteine carboxylmethyltransferase family protein [Vicinamibacterales bacterium]